MSLVHGALLAFAPVVIAVTVATAHAHRSLAGALDGGVSLRTALDYRKLCPIAEVSQCIVTKVRSSSAAAAFQQT